MNTTELFGPDAAPLTATHTASSGDAPLTNPDIAGITADSRQVQPGFVFAALKGVATDGRRFAGEARLAVLLDSVEEPAPAEALRWASHLGEEAYVVDLAWLRSTPWLTRNTGLIEANGSWNTIGTRPL